MEAHQASPSLGFSRQEHWSGLPFPSLIGRVRVPQKYIQVIYSRSIFRTGGADCGSDLQLLIAKFRLKLKKVGKTSRPFKYDLNQIPYDYTVEMTNRSKGLDIIDCLKNFGQRLVTLVRW